MFIKKDLRKVDEILADPNDSRDILKLAKRPAEFNGGISILCRDSRSLLNLRVLNLYDNALTNLNGIGILANSPVEEINLGNNSLSILPLEFSSLKTIRRLWLEDNDFEDFPVGVCALHGLTSLRLSGNKLKTVPESIANLRQLDTLALDNNEFLYFPREILELKELKNLWIRQNSIVELPNDLSLLERLEVLSVSSNKLLALPECVSMMFSLKHIYANGNSITSTDDGLPTGLCQLKNLKTLNMANNAIEKLPLDWFSLWGPLNIESGDFEGAKALGLVIQLAGNSCF